MIQQKQPIRFMQSKAGDIVSLKPTGVHARAGACVR